MIKQITTIDALKKIENEDYSDIIEVNFDNIDEELERLESEGII